MKTSELQVLKAVVEIMCPWCHATARVTLGRGPHRCPACPAVISDLQLHIALASAISTAAA